MTKYHYSPKIGKPTICYATQRPCKYGDSFPTEAAANNHALKLQAEDLTKSIQSGPSPVASEKISRTMSYTLRHKPESLGVVLNEGGWVPIAELASALSTHFKQPISVAQVLDVVDTDSKQRYAVEGELIRASQGHSIPVDLGLKVSKAPSLLFHGTVSAAIEPIFAEGLKPGSRQFVHLSANLETATTVGARRGKPIILQVNTEEAEKAGIKFRQAANGVWLTEHVPAPFLSVYSS